MVVPEFLNRIIELARRGIPGAFPNPLVGALLEVDGCIIGEGWHQAYGKAHAEVHAIASVTQTELLQKATLYVSLEPCNHFGKTPPCVNLILDHHIPNVVIGIRDPFPEVNGKGIERLRQHGVSVSMAPDPTPFQELNRYFITNVVHQRPYITLKFARSSDGFLAAVDDQGFPVRTKISGDFSRFHTHSLRATHQAILVGGTTFRTDRPELTNRNFPGSSPVRIILSNSLSTFEMEGWFTCGPDVILISSRDIYLPWPHRVVKPGNNLSETLMRLLQQEKIGSILVEGGRMVLQHFLDAGCWDELQVITSPKTLIHGVPAPVLPDLPVRETMLLDADRLDIYRNPMHV